ncbi:MAG TPA: hypothetical protein VLK33_10665 [Terriglobales bacterium]|nr:hypothetical protein [Terriglobales bacterium]
MNRNRYLALVLFVIGMVGMGLLQVVYHDFAFTWQPVPDSLPARGAIAIISGLVIIAASLALLVQATQTIAIRIIFPILVIWQLLKVPSVIAAPGMEAVWLGYGEIAVLLAGGWVLFARLSNLDGSAFFKHITGDRGVRIATIYFAIALLPIGLSHIMYAGITASFVPAWMPFRTAWAYITGFGQMACGLGVLFSVLPRLAAMIETAMLAIFAFFVWGPQTWFSSTPVMPNMPPGIRLPLTAFLITWVIGASAFIVAVNMVPKRKVG